MRIRMTRTTRGAPDGIRIQTYHDGEVYSAPRDLSPALVETFLSEGWAEAIDDAPGPTETKPVRPKKKKKGRT